ncbi:prolyl oligopeptidase family serine peptidase [Neorhizobium galegae]|uniref:Glyoxalase family protein n=1 Tax=Neorhizobium galegae bv. orientalis str. HAMBI 540 TaxID=1028800 RepID=A0A068STS6_NEOGA|nr:prolyl oligopeptidase family serine peptidase [Neorhizobium galegae]CDN48455.1 Glyoxalase family protein [Neorhizobium galegae bv. orientalis str. HAMBI 540]CDZ45915.1 MhqO [Neorhizobium galegae bv. orientalis]
MTSGLHHITAITRKIQSNVDFYAGFLGLRLVKRTAGFEDARQLHLFYGDGAATPGSLVTFLAWEDGSLGRVGHGAPSEIGFAIAPEAIGFWLTRALQFNVKLSGPAQEFGEPVLRLIDPDGIIVKLVGVEETTPWVWWSGGGISEVDAIRKLYGATILSEKPEQTAEFLTRHMGLRLGSKDGNIQRLVSDARDIVDVRDAGGFWTAAPGTGTIDHIAFRAVDRPEVEAVHAGLLAEDAGEMNMHDRHYFHSLYVREPSGTLIELATDGPGFTADEPVETLGSELFIPAHFKEDHDVLRVMLPQFGLPGEERIIYRDLPFVHRIHMPERWDGSTLVLMHGSGGNETTMLPFGRKAAPNAMLIGVRGRSTDEGHPRYFRRFTEMTFDQKEIVSEAEAFVAFVEELGPAYGVDPARTVFAGWSNGGNMIGAVMQLHPDLIRRAVLLRSMNCLEDRPAVDLTGAQVLSLSATDDFYGSLARELEERLFADGAEVTARTLDANHGIGTEDEMIARDWLIEKGF